MLSVTGRPLHRKGAVGGTGSVPKLRAMPARDRRVLEGAVIPAGRKHFSFLPVPCANDLGSGSFSDE